MLGYFARGLVQALGAHFIVSSVLSLVVSVLWCRTAAAPAGSAAVVAQRLFAWRVLPSAAGLLAGLLVALGYLLWEVRVEEENVAGFALVMAAGGLALALSAAARTLIVLCRTSRIRRHLTASISETLPVGGLSAAVIDSAFPVVAIVGLFTSRLFVARSVLEACSSEELDAVLAHEGAHARQYDNLRRLALAGTPDLLSLWPSGRRLDAAWMRAAELAADEMAARDRGRGVDLAAALVKVARLATTATDPLPASALYRGEPITERVHRLLDPPAPTGSRQWPLWLRVAGFAVLLALSAAALPLVHAAGEQLLAIGR